MVDPARRRSGIGRILLREAVATAGTAQVFTLTNASNCPMRALLAAEDWPFSGGLGGLDEGDPELVFYTEPPGQAGASRRLTYRVARYRNPAARSCGQSAGAASITAMPTFCAADGTELADHVQGEGTPLIRPPGGPGGASVDLGDLGGLSEQRQLIMLDMRGTGQSAIPVDPASHRC